MCVLQLLAAANHRVLVKEFSISFQGISNTAAPILVEVERHLDAGDDGDALTLAKLNSADDETLQASAQENLDGTSPPSISGVALFSELVHPQGGFNWQAPFGGEIVVPGGGRLGILVTAGAAVDCVARMVAEE